MPFNLSLSRILATLSSVALVGLVFVFVPIFVSADIAGGQYYGNTYYNCNTSPYATAYSSSNTVYYYGSAPTQNCGPGTLLVYVQVQNNAQNGIVRAPGDFTTTISGFSPSPATVSGSQSGVSVSVAGQYSVTALPVAGFSPTYSTGCSGNFSYGDHGLCIVTESAVGSYSVVATPYPYLYTGTTPVTCAPAYQTVTLGQAATFWANGGSGVYNWATPSQTYLGAKASLTTTLNTTGSQIVTVSTDTQTATCTVNVVGGNGPVVYRNSNYTTTYAPSTSSSAYAYTGAGNSGQTTITSAYVPALPNTGFEPLDVMLGKDGGAPLAFALVVLGAFGIVFAPYARKIIIAPTR